MLPLIKFEEERKPVIRLSARSGCTVGNRILSNGRPATIRTEKNKRLAEGRLTGRKLMALPGEVAVHIFLWLQCFLRQALGVTARPWCPGEPSSLPLRELAPDETNTQPFPLRARCRPLKTHVGSALEHACRRDAEARTCRPCCVNPGLAEVLKQPETTRTRSIYHGLSSSLRL